MKLQDFYDGKAFDAYTYFGAHPQKKGGVLFRTYAPQAARVAVIGDWNDWQPEDMPQHAQSGVFSLSVPEAAEGMRYKYKIWHADGTDVDHADPYGFGMELRPGSASIVTALKGCYQFTDEAWMATRDKNYDKPLNIYEMHFGSWRKNPDDEENGWYRYHELADTLIPYVKENGFTHIEFLPLSEHPADESWGYQNTGFFSPTSRYGTARDLMELVDRCHAAGIGVIMDFVPVHFAIDSYGLSWYDGTALYEYPADDVANSEWGTRNFNHSRREAACLLQSAASYWLAEYHFDGIRMDAISRAIYWQGDPNRGINSPNVEFIRSMNAGLQALHPTAMLIAEDSTVFPKVTAPVQHGGLGFDYKWDLGWMHDTLNFFKTPPAERPLHYHKLSFSMRYFYNELYLLPFSHDEVVHGKATIVNQMWGQYEDKFPQARALYMYMFTHPGKKLNFMGNELGHFREWDEKRELDWDLLEYPLHDSFSQYIKKLGEIYAKYPALHTGEYDMRAFEWLEVNAEAQAVYIYQRMVPGEKSGQKLVVALNLSDKKHSHTLRLEKATCFTEVLNSNWNIYSGTAETKPKKLRSKKAGTGHTLTLPLAPFSGIIYLRS